MEGHAKSGYKLQFEKKMFNTDRCFNVCEIEPTNDVFVCVQVRAVLVWDHLISSSDFYEYSWGSGDICSVIHHRIIA